MTDDERFYRICWKGEWALLRSSVCTGNVEVWDQTIGCPECGMNLWYLPTHDQWPEWDKMNAPPSDWWQTWESHAKADNPYEPYDNLFYQLHPFMFDDCHDAGDEQHDAS